MKKPFSDQFVTEVVMIVAFALCNGVKAAICNFLGISPLGQFVGTIALLLAFIGILRARVFAKLLDLLAQLVAGIGTLPDRFSEGLAKLRPVSFASFFEATHGLTVKDFRTFSDVYSQYIGDRNPTRLLPDLDPRVFKQIQRLWRQYNCRLALWSASLAAVITLCTLRGYESFWCLLYTSVLLVVAVCFICDTCFASPLTDVFTTDVVAASGVASLIVVTTGFVEFFTKPIEHLWVPYPQLKLWLMEDWAFQPVGLPVNVNRFFALFMLAFAICIIAYRYLSQTGQALALWWERWQELEWNAQAQSCTTTCEAPCATEATPEPEASDDIQRAVAVEVTSPNPTLSATQTRVTVTRVKPGHVAAEHIIRKKS